MTVTKLTWTEDRGSCPRFPLHTLQACAQQDEYDIRTKQWNMNEISPYSPSHIFSSSTPPPTFSFSFSPFNLPSLPASAASCSGRTLRCVHRIFSPFQPLPLPFSFSYSPLNLPSLPESAASSSGRTLRYVLCWHFVSWCPIHPGEGERVRYGEFNVGSERTMD